MSMIMAMLMMMTMTMTMSRRTVMPLAVTGLQAPAALYLVDSRCPFLEASWPQISLHFQGNSNNLHRIVVDDFTDSMTYLLMVGKTDIRCVG